MKNLMKISLTVGVCLYICTGISAIGKPKTVLTEEQKKERIAKYKAIAAEYLIEDKKAFAEACEKAKTSGKHLLVIAGTKGCSWCRLLDKSLKTPELATIVDANYIYIKIYYLSDSHILDGMKHIGMVPNIAIISGDKKLLKRFNPVSLETKKPNGYDLKKLSEFLLEWAPKQADSSK